MDKEKEIEEMYKITKCALDIQFGCGDMVDIGDKEVATEMVVEDLQQAGYGNVKQAYKEAAAQANAALKIAQKQAVKEFVDYAREVIVKQFSYNETEKLKACGALKLLYDKVEEFSAGER